MEQPGRPVAQRNLVALRSRKAPPTRLAAPEEDAFRRRAADSYEVGADLCSNDRVATQPRLPRETRRLSDGRVEGVKAVRHRDDAIDAT